MLTYQLVETDFDRKNMKSVHWRRTELAIDKRNLLFNEKLRNRSVLPRIKTEHTFTVVSFFSIATIYCKYVLYVFEFSLLSRRLVSKMFVKVPTENDALTSPMKYGCLQFPHSKEVR